MKGVELFLVASAFLAFAWSLASASDPDPLQDFCVAINDTKDGVFVNGKFCQDPKLAKAEDFFYSGLNIPRNTSNPVGSTVTQVNVAQILGLNTLGISLARIDYAPYGGLNPPHTHPRASEILVVLEGTLYVGFVTSNPENRLITKVLYPGDVFVFPVGLIHFQLNIGKTNAVAFAGLSSQNPGVITIAKAVFGSNPPINPDVLTKAFQLDKNIVTSLQSRLQPINRHAFKRFTHPKQENLEDLNLVTCQATMKGVYFLASFLFLALASSFASASDPSPLQDFCVALNDTKNAVFVNGKFCKDPMLAKAEDFFFSGLNVPGNTSNQLGSKVTPVNVEQIPGLNTLGVSLARVDFAPYGGLNPPHTHPRATEILVVLEGTLYVGFVTSNPDNRLITKVLYPGDVFVFPVGLIHFQLNIGKTNAVAFAAFGSQNPGVITIAKAVFGSNPPINPDVLTKAFQLDKNVVKYLQSQFWWDNN
ncbi:Germin-like protein subfamily 1 member 18 [Theobroma cacao]|uniref:Germin-like protein subfamily 1 member 18 n=3 Tax=Theobroma cacao TaxID=3641 RepID=A0A061F0C3_THECC|nr:Germin-like protein subfamily 1 member 18 [Theobroma cacao]